MNLVRRYSNTFSPIPSRRRILFPAVLVVYTLVLGGAKAETPSAGAPEERPDVLFIAVDDLNDWNTLLDPEAPIRTPHLSRLAERGMLFTRAYCASPACNPSRTATLTGLRPTTSGVYGNRSDWRKALPKRKTVMQQFAAAGYSVRGAGKIFHHHLDGAFHDDASFDDFQPMMPQRYPETKLNGAPEYGSKNTDWGAWPPRVEDSIDFQTAQYCIDCLDRRSEIDQPMFLACGIFKPHSPFFAPATYHRSSDVPLPPRRSDDWNDLPSGADALLGPKRWFWNGMQQLDQRLPGSYQAFIQSYAACVAHADAQIGRVLDALDRSPRGNRTSIVLWSDHGFHLGEKNHIEKFALWEKTTHVPLIVVAPGVTSAAARCDRPVDLMALYPTLLGLAGLKTTDRSDGKDLLPLLRDPEAEWSTPAVTTYMPGNHAVRSEHFRYIRYADGSEELYDHRSDPREWNNLAADPGYAAIIRSHREWIPKAERPPVGDLRRR